jgi:V/A-type H+-transporting ATPase subunit F
VRKILAIGNQDFTLAFRAMGCTAHVVQSGEQGRDMLLTSLTQEYGIIFIAESIARLCMDDISQLSDTTSMPIVTILPDTFQEEKGAAETRIRQMVKRAVGIDLPD